MHTARAGSCPSIIDRLLELNRVFAEMKVFPGGCRRTLDELEMRLRPGPARRVERVPYNDPSDPTGVWVVIVHILLFPHHRPTLVNNVPDRASGILSAPQHIRKRKVDVNPATLAVVVTRVKTPETLVHHGVTGQLDLHDINRMQTVVRPPTHAD